MCAPYPLGYRLHVRCFVQVTPSAEAGADLQRALGGVRTTAPEQWHVTLVFLGEVAAPPDLGAVRSPALRLRLEGSGTFRRAGVVWAGIGGDVAGLRRLQSEVVATCRAQGFLLEDRPYRPHVTVGRGLRPDVLAGYRGPEWTVDELQVVESRLGARAVHTVLERVRISAA